MKTTSEPQRTTSEEQHKIFLEQQKTTSYQQKQFHNNEKVLQNNNNIHFQNIKNDQNTTFRSKTYSARLWLSMFEHGAEFDRTRV